MKITVGTFRPNFNELYTSMTAGIEGSCVVVCNCGTGLWTRQGVFEHWQNGHFDEVVNREVADDPQDVL